MRRERVLQPLGAWSGMSREHHRAECAPLVGHGARECVDRARDVLAHVRRIDAENVASLRDAVLASYRGDSFGIPARVEDHGIRSQGNDVDAIEGGVSSLSDLVATVGRARNHVIAWAKAFQNPPERLPVGGAVDLGEAEV